ncbi:MAG: phosphotransferase [Caldilineaceae bacterium]
MLTSHLITNHWPLDNVSFGETFQSYPTRRVMRVHAAQGAFVAKIDSQPPAYEAACQPYAIFDFLVEQAFPHIPALLKTRDGQPLLYRDGQSIALMEYIDGGQPDNSPATWEALGKAVAGLNAITDCPVPYAIPTDRAIAELTAGAQTHSHPKQFLDFIAMLSPLLTTPTHGLVHGEINRANVRQRHDGALVIIDWDEAGHGPTVLEAGYPLLTVFLTEKLHFQRLQAQAFYRGYFGAHSPGAAEQDLLFRAALLHALRYMAFANQQQRWARIYYAVTHRTHLLNAIFDRP